MNDKSQNNEYESVIRHVRQPDNRLFSDQ